MKGDKKAFKKMYKADCTAMRTDGPFIEAGENDNLIVQRLAADPNAVGIFGYSFLFENQDQLQPLSIAGVEPSMEAIASGKYAISRPLYTEALAMVDEANPPDGLDEVRRALQSLGATEAEEV